MLLCNTVFFMFSFTPRTLGFQTPGEEVFGPQKHTIQTPFTSGGMTGRLGESWDLNGAWRHFEDLNF